MSKDTGGSAFPTSPNTQAGYFSHHGMTLRDYFAAKAMQTLLSASMSSKNETALDLIFPSSYEIADAMLKERTK